MNGDMHDAGSSPGDDLFDLPSDAPSAKDAGSTPSSAAGADLDLPASALPKRPMSSSPAGPPLSNVDSSAAGILEQVRPRPAKVEAPAPVAVAAPKKPRFVRPSGPWIAFGALALGNALILGFVVLRGSGSSEPTHTDAPAQTATAGVLPLGRTADAAHGTGSTTSDTTRDTGHESAHDTSAAASADSSHAAPHGAEHDVARSDAHTDAHNDSRSSSKPKTSTPREIPALFDGAAVDLARKSLKDARDDVDAGHRSAARARLGRIGLAIDAIAPAQRESIRAEVALLLAQTIQADADEAARAK